MIGSVNGVIIWTQNLARLTKFYTETMGLTPILSAHISSISSGAR